MTEMPSRICRALALGLILPFGQPAEAQDTPAFFPTGAVYQQARHVSLDRPDKLGVAGVDPSHHGSYANEPYYAFLKDPATGKLYLVSDGRLKAELTPVPGSAGARRQPDGKSLWLVAKYAINVIRSDTPATGLSDAVLSVNDPACGEQECFLVTGTESFPELPSGQDPYTSYVVSEPRPNDTSTGKIAWGSAFTPKPNEPVYYLTGCWNVTMLAYLDYQDPQCSKALLALPGPDSRNYQSVQGTMVLPYGWLFDADVYSGGESITTMLSTSQDISSTVQRTTGYNVSGSASASYGVVEVDASFSFKSSSSQMQKFANMSADKTAFTQSQYHHTEYALVVDKINGDLDPGFRSRGIEALLPAYRAGTLSDQTLQDFFSVWGTHYAYAVTYGTQGSATETYSEQQMKALIEKGVKYSQAWQAEATVKVMGSGGTLGGGSSSESDQQMQNDFSSIMSSSKTNYVCSGGASCGGGVPSGTPLVPVFLDLRPISELFGPPYYSDPEIVLGLRDRVYGALQGYAFVNLPKGQPAYGIVSLTFQPAVCNGVPCAQAVPNSTWSFDPVTIVPGQNDHLVPLVGVSPSADVPGGFFLDYSQGTPTTAYVPSGDSVSLTGSYLLNAFASWGDPRMSEGFQQTSRAFSSLVFPSQSGQTVQLADPLSITLGPAAPVNVSVPIIVGPADLGGLLGVN